MMDSRYDSPNMNIDRMIWRIDRTTECKPSLITAVSYCEELGDTVYEVLEMQPGWPEHKYHKIPTAGEMRDHGWEFLV